MMYAFLTPSVSAFRARLLLALSLALAVVLTAGSTALAGEFISGDVYRLAPDQVVQDDLYIGANEVYIEGTLDGDLYAGATVIHITGEVKGDVFAAANSVIIQGPVGDDVFAAGNGVLIDAPVGGDLFAAGGGGSAAFAMPGIPATTIASPGVRVTSQAQIGGDAFLVGGLAEMDGHVMQDLRMFSGEARLQGRVDGNAEIRAEQIAVDAQARVAGILTYSTPEQMELPAGVAEQFRYEPPARAEETARPLSRILGWIVRTILIFLGFLLLGLALHRFAPQTLERPLAFLRQDPVMTGVWGLVAGVLLAVIPIVSGLLVIFTWIFWGLWPALVVGLLLFGALVALWIFSPLLTGLWLGERIRERLGGETPLWLGMALGLAVLVLLSRVPLLGALVYLLSFVLALGALLRSTRVAPSEPAQVR